MEVLRISNFGKDFITGIYQSNFDVRYTAREAQILQLSFETQSSFMYFVWLFVFAFDQLLSYWKSKLKGIYIFHKCSCLTIFAYIT